MAFSIQDKVSAVTIIGSSQSRHQSGLACIALALAN